VEGESRKREERGRGERRMTKRMERFHSGG
jgi:hypothetical protein